uniref:(+)-abscisic acid 8'-hydroxylase n=1 Tax=Araucaria cunninghamii TaxID=56994 RepID=A0A0D6R0I1_ARACU
MASYLITLFGFAVLFLFIRLWWYSQQFSRRKPLPLPPGSMGWPYIGETFKLYSQNPNVFFAAKQKRYGHIFKTHVLGCPCVMIASPEAAKFVLSSQAHLFKPTFPASKEGMLGPQALFFHQGDYHARLRKLVQSSFLPEVIRKLVPDIESLALRALNSWEGSTINTFHEMKRFAFDVSLLSIFGRHHVFDKENIKKSYYTLEKGYNSMPLNLPGTPFHKSMKARKQLSQILINIITERRSSSLHHEGLLETLMMSKDGSCGLPLTDNQIADNIIGVIFAAQDTTASVLTWILKYLRDHTGLLEAVTAEQKDVRQAKGGVEEGYLTWADTKGMPLTSRVIQETLRIATILSFTFREAVQDVEYKGYRIPKGWKVMPLFRNIHHSPEFFPDPQKFDPSRFEVPPKPNTFLPFGNGAHSCPGSELAKLEMLILVHHLTTKYRWDIVGSENGIQYGPFPVPKQGLPVRISRKSKNDTLVDPPFRGPS